MTAADSFERIIEDSGLNACDYARKRGVGSLSDVTCRGCAFAGSGSCDTKMRSDLVRRCKDVAAGDPRSGCKVADDERESGHVNIGEVATFPGAKADKAQALKVLEEAAEVFGAWQAFNADQDGNTSAIFLLLDECADVIQAVSNLVAALNVVDFAPYMDDCRERNEKRGRFDGRR